MDKQQQIHGFHVTSLAEFGVCTAFQCWSSFVLNCEETELDKNE